MFYSTMNDFNGGKEKSVKFKCTRYTASQAFKLSRFVVHVVKCDMCKKNANKILTIQIWSEFQSTHKVKQMASDKN